MPTCTVTVFRPSASLRSTWYWRTRPTSSTSIPAMRPISLAVSTSSTPAWPMEISLMMDWSASRSMTRKSRRPSLKSAVTMLPERIDPASGAFRGASSSSTAILTVARSRSFSRISATLLATSR